MPPSLATPALQCPLAPHDLLVGSIPDVRPLLAEGLLYKKPSEALEFPVCQGDRHTMGARLDDYVTQRVPMRALVQETLEVGAPVRLIGAPAELVETHADALPVRAPLTLIDELPYNHRARARCARRPCFYRDADGALIVAVHSGADYIRHMAAILRHAIHTIAGHDAEAALTIVRAPALERELCAWTGFDAMISPGDAIFYGYASDLLAHLKAEGQVALTYRETRENFYYYTERYTLQNGQVVSFYECKHHGWGDLSAKTMQRAAALGASDIFYVAKGAACASPAQVYATIACPTSYITARHDRITRTLEGRPPNPLVAWQPSLDTGRHFSPPTVMEEDVALRDTLTASGATSLDNEAAQIAAALDDLATQPSPTLQAQAPPTAQLGDATPRTGWSRPTRSEGQGYAGRACEGDGQHRLGGEARPRRDPPNLAVTGFAALQFLTDYVARPDEIHDPVRFDLVNNHTPEALAQRRAMMRRMFGLIDAYLCWRGAA